MSKKIPHELAATEARELYRRVYADSVGSFSLGGAFRHPEISEKARASASAAHDDYLVQFDEDYKPPVPATAAK